MNMSAFWDAITGLVEMPINFTFIGWDSLKELLPDVTVTLAKTLEQYNEHRQNHACNVLYS